MKAIIYFYSILFVILFSSCGTRKVRYYSTDYTGDSNLKSFERSLVLIPQTSISNIDDENPSKRKFANFKEDTIHVDSFFIFSYEVTNLGYWLFLKDLRNSDTNLYKSMYPNEYVWRNKFENYAFYEQYYLRHPGYRMYPVVGITYEQAQYYCKWLTTKYNSNKKRKFQNVEFKLPSKAQWLVAAIGDDFNKTFPWKENSLQNSKGKWLANFRVIDQVQILKDTGFIDCYNRSHYLENCFRIINSYNQKDAETAKFQFCYCSNSYMTTPVDYFYPNSYGLYNMSGNVEEFVREKGISKGGSWNDTGYYLQLQIEESYELDESASFERGFRIVMEFTK